MLKQTVLTFMLVMSSNAQSMCYKLYDAKHNVIYQEKTPPFNMAAPNYSPEYHASRARGEYVVITVSDCVTPPISGVGNNDSRGRYTYDKDGNKVYQFSKGKKR